MGDRGNIIIKTGSDPLLYLYTHWAGSELSNILAKALKRGKSRWEDPSYMARIIFSEMTTGSEREETGFGLSTTMGDGDTELMVDFDKQAVVKCARRTSDPDGDLVGFARFVETNI